jgi:hypothetical protein
MLGMTEGTEVAIQKRANYNNKYSNYLINDRSNWIRPHSMCEVIQSNVSVTTFIPTLPAIVVSYHSRMLHAPSVSSKARLRFEEALMTLPIIT